MSVGLMLRDGGVARACRRGVLALALTTLLLPLCASGEGDATRALERSEVSALQEKLVALAEEARPKTVCVFGVIGLGSGAVVDAEGTVVTNAHVAAGARYAIVLTHDGEKRLYRRRGIDYEKDLAVLEPCEAPEAPAPHFTLTRKRPAEGTFVAALGFPGGPRDADAHPTFTVGRVVAGRGLPNVMGVLDYSDAIRTDAPIFSGNSGGPLVDLQGRLVGINGAVEMGEEVGSMSIPASRVAERLKLLTGGVIRLPGGNVLDPSKSSVLRFLEEQLDPIVKNMMTQRQHGRGGMSLSPAAARALPAVGDPEAAAAFIARSAGSIRNRILKGTFEKLLEHAGDAAVELTDEKGAHAIGAVISANEVVACAGALGAGATTLTAAGGRSFRVVARAEGHDLVLARLEKGAVLAFRGDAAVGPVGTLVGVVGPKGALAAGVLSAPARPISEATSRLLAMSAGGGLQDKLILAFGKLARALDLKELVAIAKQLEVAMEVRRGFAAGSAPRGFERVLSHDAPCGPMVLGAPLVDADGKLLGVHVAVAHFGTSYAVPIETIRQAFRAGRLGKAGQKESGGNGGKGSKGPKGSSKPAENGER
ncbi:MAG: trypsin-like peptidase domain-containing protein [Planctomycetes bacterium]|nr:trypsin-like peptidase domain-containing protein [Planctomycetota bacterium]